MNSDDQVSKITSAPSAPAGFGTAVAVPPVAGGVAMSHRQTLEALSGLLLVLFFSMLSGTIVATALPQILGTLDGSQNQYTWVVTAALLTSTAATPLWGKLADLFDKKALVQIAIVLFVVGSIVCGLAQSAGQLIAARAFQGLGVGGLQALVQIVIASIVSPRERGRYNGYLGGVMALATVSGPLLGGAIVDTSWLGWRWCFFVGVPVAVVALVVLQLTLKLPPAPRANVRIDYLGATLISSGVSLLLIWVSFVDDSFAWASWQTAAMVGGSVLLLALAAWVESRAAEPIVPPRLVRQRVTALAILASVAVGVAMFGGAVFLGQYFQIGRGYSPTEAGLLMIPMMIGVTVSSVVVGRLVTKSGKVKSYIVTGSIVLVVGFAAMGVIDHTTSLAYLGVAMFVIGAGVGMSMQNLVLAVQNAVPLSDIGAASSTVTFFRSLGGAVGVSVLGTILARQVRDQITTDLVASGVPASSGGDATGSLDLNALPGFVEQIVREAYGDATGHIFLVSAVVATIGVLAAVLLRPVTLRSTVDLAAPAGPLGSTDPLDEVANRPAAMDAVRTSDEYEGSVRDRR